MLDFGWLQIEPPPGWPPLSCLLVAGGRTPDPDWLHKSLSLPGLQSVIAVDGGVTPLRELDVVPDWLVGDGDSAAVDDWGWAERNCRRGVRRHHPDKDDTDLELALRLINDHHPDNTTLLACGVWGGRFDHLYAAIHSLARPKPNAILADQQEMVFFLRSQQSCRLHFTRIPLCISLLPLTPYCIGVEIDNVRWPLTNAVLSASFQYAISNRLDDPAQPVTICQSEGCLAVYICWFG
ncbi:MAG: thiamine diphosphokinase [Negativicutes bacterium]|nr:thiamine diphosphokinase [Negativicutes bacterium]